MSILYGTWCLEESAVMRVARALEDRRSLEPVAAAPASTGQRSRPSSQPGVAVIQVRGLLRHHAPTSWLDLLFGGSSTSYDELTQVIHAYQADPDVKALVLDFDSPGGTTAGCVEAAQVIYSYRGKKPIIAVANSLAASAGYWLASQCAELFVSPSGVVGSIGVFGIHQDISRAADKAGVTTTFIKAGKYKTLGNPFEPLSDEASKRLQVGVDYAYEQFLSDVAKGRGVSVRQVRNGFGEGDVVTPKQAVAEGMVDGIKTIGEVVGLAMRAQPGGSGGGARAALVADQDGRERLGRMRLAVMRSRFEAAASETASLLDRTASFTSPEDEASKRQRLARFRAVAGDLKAVSKTPYNVTLTDAVPRKQREAAERALRECKADLGISGFVSLHFFIQSAREPHDFVGLSVSEPHPKEMWILIDQTTRDAEDVARTVAHECWHVANPDVSGSSAEYQADVYAANYIRLRQRSF